jgi:hypothetical protein
VQVNEIFVLHDQRSKLNSSCAVNRSKVRHYITSREQSAVLQPTTQWLHTNAKILPLRVAINLIAPTNHMKTLTDCFGREVRLTDERLAHILERPELNGMDAEIEVLLSQPRFVRLSRQDTTVRLFYSFYPATLVGGKWLCVVVKYEEADAFVVTAYLTNRPKAGEDLWPTK